MNFQIILHKLVKYELGRYEKLYEELAGKFPLLPKGSLLDRNGHIYRAFREDGRQYQKPINKDTQLLQEVRLRQHLKKSLPDLKGRINACRLFLINERFYDPLAIEEKSKELYQGGLGKELFLEGDISSEEWLNEKYVRNCFPFKDRHVTAGGIHVRSKAEAMIGTQMEHFDILFRPEPCIQVGSQHMYPDFEVFLPGIRRRIYIEHFGKMDDPDYLKKAMYKLQNYNKAGLYLGVNFFFTWESREKPLTINEINQLLEEIMALDR